MRIQAHPTAASTRPSTTKSTRSPHAPAMKATPAATPAKAAATPAKAAQVAAAPETYGGAGSLLDAQA